jgi:hypothetical protein
VRISTELAADGVTLVGTVDDNGDGTGLVRTYNSDGTVATEAVLTDLPIQPAFPPLDPLGRMATLSAILHDDVEDWANASGYSVEHLIHEAEAWSIG